ncbi:Alpha/Beta hydrolase protein [Talaromyces proteolyticus]|uniref:Alpha/Beta hydrolase protein n=1 Tax=Talaromyces proteolyticus TaxID=1131652 RepID=A0AAD4KY26_9EURO|nr:Alpha/Beta hydrolase protein [Talaromyces proteolyticus]KAH8703012.1 Alpha/Beta hydrolase protein [Talaromyces proteolyticus]
MTTERKVSFNSRGLNVVGILRSPDTSATNRKRAAIVVSHPGGGVKEQTAGLYASLLTEQGYITLAFDAAYQGESSGEPRGLEDPAQRVEDIKSAVTYLSLLPEVDTERIGGLGICASGGYINFAAQTDVRIKAVAGVSSVDFGQMIREGVKDTAAASPASAIAGTLEAAAKARLAEAKGEEYAQLPFAPDDPATVPDVYPALYKEAADYYRTPRGGHCRSTNRFPLRSTDLLANFDAFAFNHLISPRPLLMIAGSDADTKYFSEIAIEKAKEPKELFVVPGKTHIALYDDSSVVLPKLVDFYSKSISK